MKIIEGAENLFYKKLGMWASDCAEQIPEDDKDKSLSFIWDLNSKTFNWKTKILLTKSPIEQLLLAEMIFLTDGYRDIESLDSLVPDYIEYWGAYFIPQYRVGSYTADFVIVCQYHDRMKFIAVECDGHDFHEKTKQQAIHDKKRDRFFTSKGLKILRFTGSEIYQRSSECFDEIQSLVEITMDELLVEAGKIQPRKAAV